MLVDGYESMNSDQRRQIRRMSMYGTLLFMLAILAAITAAILSSTWLGVVAVIFLVPGVVALYRVGRSI